jgi:hypothetical protein
LLFYYNNIITKKYFSKIFAKEKSVGNSLYIHLIKIVIQTFRWKSLRGWDSRPQLIVVSGLFRWESLRGWDFLATTCCCLGSLFSRWNSGYHGAFLINFFLFSRWNSGYHEAFLTIFFLFSQWNSGYHEAFLMKFFLFSRRNFGYPEAFLTNFFLFSRRNFGYHEAFPTNFFLFSRRYDLGEGSFHIYHKEYLHRIRLVKNLAY